jgi:hypothetical protein
MIRVKALFILSKRTSNTLFMRHTIVLVIAVLEELQGG